MKKIQEYFTQDITFRYDSKEEKIKHIKTMTQLGYTVIPQNQLPTFLRKEHIVAYRRNIAVDQ